MLILGASGGCGRWATRLAVERGHNVRVIVREHSRFDVAAGVELIEGSVLDRDLLDPALAGVDSVLSCLGLRRRHPRNPWSRVTSPPELTARVTQLLVDEMPRHNISRLVAISAGGVGDSAASTSRINRWLFRNSKIAVSYRDLENMEQILNASPLDWQAVRPTTLTHGRHTGQPKVVDRYGLLTRISRADVAHWMLDTVEHEGDLSSARTPMIATHA